MSRWGWPEERAEEAEEEEEEAAEGEVEA